MQFTHWCRREPPHTLSKKPLTDWREQHVSPLSADMCTRQSGWSSPSDHTDSCCKPVRDCSHAQPGPGRRTSGRRLCVNAKSAWRQGPLARQAVARWMRPLPTCMVGAASALLDWQQMCIIRMYDLEAARHWRTWQLQLVQAQAPQPGQAADACQLGQRQHRVLQLQPCEGRQSVQRHMLHVRFADEPQVSQRRAAHAELVEICSSGKTVMLGWACKTAPCTLWSTAPRFLSLKHRCSVQCTHTVNNTPVMPKGADQPRHDLSHDSHSCCRVLRAPMSGRLRSNCSSFCSSRCPYVFADMLGGQRAVALQERLAMISASPKPKVVARQSIAAAVVHGVKHTSSDGGRGSLSR